jgi:hypothetical protein
MNVADMFKGAQRHASKAGRSEASSLYFGPDKGLDPAVEPAERLIDSGDMTRAFELLQSVERSAASNLRLAAACLASGHADLASMFFHDSAGAYYHRLRNHCHLVPQVRPRVELAMARSRWLDNVSEWETTVEIDHGQARIVFSPGFARVGRQRQVHILRRAALIAPLFWSVWPLRRRPLRWLVSLQDAGMDGHLGFCGKDSALLVPDPQFLQSIGYTCFRQQVGKHFVPWRNRSPTIFWRGGANGLVGRKPGSYNSSFEWCPRLNLCAHAQTSRYADRMDVAITNLSPAFRKDTISERRKLARFMRQYVPAIDQMQYQYLIDIDGWANSWSGLFQKLILGAAILKVNSPTAAKQWYYDRMLPFEHYLPVKSDLSNLDNTIAWAEARPRETERIAEKAKQLGSSLTIEKELTASIYRVAEQRWWL